MYKKLNPPEEQTMNDKLNDIKSDLECIKCTTTNTFMACMVFIGFGLCL